MNEPREYYTYIATNRSGTLYTGMTNDIHRRMSQHRAGMSAFTAKYKITRLLFVESTTDVWEAIYREKQIKGWTRAKKLHLIRMQNPRLLDLLPEEHQPIRRSSNVVQSSNRIR